ncbi:hypothetical protein, partial [Methanothermococcus sp.]|uniref:hypothetical protein n=1 Tax=Methanothermococcus sp. TaxID=2614238 RepID=UPI0025D49592
HLHRIFLHTNNLSVTLIMSICCGKFCSQGIPNLSTAKCNLKPLNIPSLLNPIFPSISNSSFIECYRI